jgi:hypothetical protein
MTVRDVHSVLGRGAVAASMLLVCLVAGVRPARAELVFFGNGRTMSVKAHRAEGDTLVLSLRAGGEMVVESALVASIGPDEVEYPEPVDENQVVQAPTVNAARTASAVVSPVYDVLIRKAAAEHGVDASLVRAVIQVESAYQPRARSSKGAVGLMQVMPATARQYGITNLWDPATNIRAGVTHLRTLLDRYPLALALAAYNAGEGAVDRFAGIPPFPETVDYVARVRALAGR